MYILYVPDFHIADCIELLAKNSRCYATHRKTDHLVMQDDDYKLYKYDIYKHYLSQHHCGGEFMMTNSAV